MADLVTVSDEELVAAAAQKVAGAIASCVNEHGSARVAIAGGSATAPLAMIREQLGATWLKVKLTWVDERRVPVDHADSNRGSAFRSGALSHDHPPQLTLPLWLDSETPEQAADRVHAGLVRDFAAGLDVCLLGMGPDGHIASLFPGHDALALPEEVLVVAIDNSPKPPPERMTLTQSLLEHTGHSFLLASGESKAPALKRLLAGDPQLPASNIPNLSIITNLSIGALT